MKNHALTAFQMINLVDDATPQATSFVVSRAILLAKLNSILRMMNDELAYMTWIETVPDEATFEDFKDIANDDEFFAEVLEEFQRLFALYKYAE